MTTRILFACALLAPIAAAHAGDVCAEALPAKATTVAYGDHEELPIDEAFRRLLVGGTCDYQGCECTTKPLEAGVACGGLSWRLSARAAADHGIFEQVAPRLTRAFEAAAASAEVRGRLIDVLAQVPSKSSANLASALFESHPDAFAQDQLLALAETGAPAFELAIKERVAEQRADGGVVQLTLAAFLVKHGSKDAELVELVRTAAAAPIVASNEQNADGSSHTTLHERLVASIALAAAGETAPWSKTFADVQRSALTALDQGQVDRARDLALYLEFFRGLRAELSYASFGYVGDRAYWHVQEYGAKYATADQVFRLIEEVART